MHKQIYDATKTQVTSLVHAAKTTYFSTKISESTTCKQLFGITKKLLSRSKSSPVPTAMPLEQLPDLFSQFFLDKVENIRDQFDCNTPVNSPSPFNYDTVFMALLLRLSSQSLQTHYGLYSRNLRPNHVLLTQSQHHYNLNALTQSCQY